MKSKIKIVLCIAMILITMMFLTGCAQEITSGEVYEKEYKESHTEIMMIPITTYNGKTSHTTIYPYVYHYPDRYIVYIKSFENDKWETADYFVPKEIYESINIGDQFEYVEGRDLSDEPYTREKSE